MAQREVIVVGAGKRVLEAALPALVRSESAFVVREVFARRAREVSAGGRRWPVRAFADFGERGLAGEPLVYVAVAKDAVPHVLERFARLDRSRADLLIDTPVVRFKHFRHARKLAGWRNVWVSEDTSALPWYDLVNEVLASGALGALRRVVFERSAYAYHGMAMAKSLIGSRSIVRARRKRLSSAYTQRDLAFDDGRGVTILDPRDYSVGHVRIEGTANSLADDPRTGTSELRLECEVTAGRLTGFRAGDLCTHLDDDEIALAEGDPAAAGPIERMDALKRVGFLRLLRSIAAGRGAWPLEEGLDDMVVDYHLERFGRYSANALTSVRSGLARALYSTLSLAAR